MSVTLLEVWRAARARSVPFSGESAGFAALALCEATERSPRQLALTDAELGEDGVVRLLSHRACSEPQADKQLRTLLGRLLEVSSSPGPSLFRVAGRAGAASLHALAEEIEKALIPLNRAAARRALVRLHRETARAVSEGKLAPVPDLEEPAQIRLSPPPPPVAPSDSKISVAPPVRETQAALRRETPPPLPVQSPIPVVVACVTPPPVAVAAVTPPPVAAPVTLPSVVVPAVTLPPVAVPAVTLPPIHAALPVMLESREPTLPLALPLNPCASEPVEHVTSPQTVVARRARGLAPPPLPAANARSEKTPRMGSVDVAVISVQAAELPPLPESPSDLTERVPPVSDALEGDDAELRALEAWPVSLPSVEPRPLEEPSAASISLEELPSEPRSLLDPSPSLPRFALDIELSPDPPTLEPPALRESPALVVGVHVADSEELAEPVLDDELETRPLPSSVSALPVEPIRHLLAPESDVRELVSEFKVQGGLSETELRRELKALAGVDLTPGAAVNVGPR